MYSIVLVCCCTASTVYSILHVLYDGMGRYCVEWRVFGGCLGGLVSFGMNAKLSLIYFISVSLTKSSCPRHSIQPLSIQVYLGNFILVLRSNSLYFFGSIDIIFI